MKQSIKIIGSILLAATLSSPAWAKHNGNPGDGGESQAGGLPGLEDRVEADEGLITTLQGQVADLLGQNNWVVVNADGTVARTSSVPGPVTVVEHVAASGTYEIAFGKDVSACAYEATFGAATGVPATQGEITVSGDTDSDSGNDVFVRTYNASGTLPTDLGFHLTVTCP